MFPVLGMGNAQNRLSQISSSLLIEDTDNKHISKQINNLIREGQVLWKV